MNIAFKILGVIGLMSLSLRADEIDEVNAINDVYSEENLINKQKQLEEQEAFANQYQPQVNESSYEREEDVNETEFDEELDFQPRVLNKLGFGAFLGSFNGSERGTRTALGLRLDMMGQDSALGVDFKTWRFIPLDSTFSTRIYQIKPWIHFYKVKNPTVGKFVPYFGIGASLNSGKSESSDPDKDYNSLGGHLNIGARSTINNFLRFFADAEYAIIKDASGFTVNLGAEYLF